MSRKEYMTPRERWMAAIAMKPVDRLPFWPKLDGAYSRVQAGQFKDMDSQALQAWIGADMHCWIPTCAKEVRKTTSIETINKDGVSRIIYHTPYGDMESVRHFDIASQSWHPMQFPVRTREDIKGMIAIYRDTTIEFNPEAAAKALAEKQRLGERASTNNGIGESPLMEWIEWIAGVEQAQFLLADHPAEVEELFDAMHQVLLQRAALLACQSQADVLYLIENTSTTLISPEQYRKYCLGHITAYGNITRAAGKPLVLHMCGHLKAILPDLAKVPAEAFEAFTSPTVGNTTLLDGRTHCPDKCLIGGTNASLWLRPVDQIIARIKQDLDALPHHRGVVVTSAGIMPPACTPQTIKTVCDWVKNYSLN